MIPQHISEFLRTVVKSTWALDLLRLLKNASGQSRTAAELTAELRGTRHMVDTILADFARWGLSIEDPTGRYRYAANAELNAIITELMTLYAERPVSVIGEIALPQPEKIIDEKIRSFVDAFRLKKD